MDNKSNNRGTVYQELNKFLNLSFQPIEKTPNIVIKGDSVESIRKKQMEIQQQQILQRRFFNTTNRTHHKALQFESARLPAYMDYEGMEYYPLISSALDLLMEESTHIGVDGKMLKIYSNKPRIKEVLEELFYDIININTNLPFWTRNTIKYGDNFVATYGEPKKGILHLKQMVNYEVERVENFVNNKPVVKFKNKINSDEYNSLEVLHFRLLGDDKFLPYGCSILNKIRRVFRQLVMAEDFMLTYRILRASEKRIYKIDVGNMEDDDIEEYIMNVATKLRRTPEINPNNGQFDYRFNPSNLDEDIYLPVRNANVVTGVDTIQGAGNLNEIADIEYLRDNLFTGLGIAKPFLTFQDASGGGKGLAQFDIRLAKKIIRIQQAMIQELNKLAMVHLFLLGFTGDDLKSFVLSLTSPSTQDEIIKIDLLKSKAQAYTDLTRADNGIAAMSHTNAKRLIFNLSDKEIVDDLKQQKLEMTIKQELVDSPVVIKKTGLFKDVDDRFGEPEDLLQPQEPQQNQQTPEMKNTKPPSPPEIGDETPPIEPLSEYMKMVKDLVYNKNIVDDKEKVILEKSNKMENENNNLITEAEKLLDNENLLSSSILDDIDV